MATVNDVLLRITGKDNTSGAINSIRGKLASASAMGGMALQQVGQQMLSLGTSAVQAATKSSTEWNQLTSNIRSTSGAVAANVEEVKGFTKQTANVFGRTISDTRAAENNLTKYGMKWGEVKQMMTGVAQIAAGTGMSEEQASQAIVSAMAGRGQALKKMGLDIKNYQDSTTGAINKTKLLADIQKKYGAAATAYAKSPEAAMNKLNNSIGTLKVSIGQGLIAVLEPLIPIVTGIANALNGWLKPITPLIAGIIAIGGGLALIGGYAMMIQPLVEIFRGLWAVIKETEIATTALAEVKGILALASGTAAAEEELLTGSLAGTAAGMEATAAATLGYDASLWSVVAAELAAVAPILLLVAALAVVAIAVYEVGKAFGWWKDVGSMIDAIKAGIQRLWSAFINNPDVKGLVNDLKSVFTELQTIVGQVAGAVGSAWNQLMSALGVNSNQNVDAVRMLIDVLGLLGKAIILPFRAGVTVILLYLKIVSALISFFINLPATVNKGLTAITKFFTHLNTVARSRVNLFINIVRKGFQRLPAVLVQVLNQVIRRIIIWTVQMLNHGRQAGQRLVTGVLTFVKQLPQEIVQWLTQTVSRVISFAGQLFSAGNSDGQNLFNGVKGAVAKIPDMVYSEFKGIAQKVISVGGDMYNAAKEVGQKLWDGIQSVMQHHSPGRFMKLTAAEFGGIADTVNAYGGEAFKSGRNFATKLQSGFGKPDFNTKIQMQRMANGMNRRTPNGLNGNSAGVVYNIHIGKQEFDLANLTEIQAKRVVNAALKGETSNSTVTNVKGASLNG